MPPYLEDISNWAQLILTLAAVGALIKTTGQQLALPDKTQDNRIAALEKWKLEVDERLEKGNAHFNENDQSNRITQKALLAIIDHELNGNSVDKLKDAKDELQSYLIDK